MNKGRAIDGVGAKNNCLAVKRRRAGGEKRTRAVNGRHGREPKQTRRLIRRVDVENRPAVVERQVGVASSVVGGCTRNRPAVIGQRGVASRKPRCHSTTRRAGAQQEPVVVGRRVVVSSRARRHWTARLCPLPAPPSVNGGAPSFPFRGVLGLPSVVTDDSRKAQKRKPAALRQSTPRLA